MKKQVLLFFALFLGCSIPVLPQGVRYDIPPILTSTGKPVSAPVISLCPGTATVSGAACSPATGQSTTDITNSTLCPIGSPVTLTGLNTCQATGDTLGNAGFWLKPGAYIYCITGSGVTGACYNLTVPIGINSSGGAVVSAANLNGDLWLGTGSGQYASMAACNTAAVAGQSCHIPQGWSETLTANLVLKDKVCFVTHGLATINMSTFSITAANGIRPCFKSLGLNASTSLGPGNVLYLKYFGTGAALDFGDATADTRGGNIEGVLVELTAAGANAIGVRERRIQTVYHNNVVVSGSGANAATQIGWLLDGTGTFTGNNVYDNCSSNGTLVSIRFIVGNLNMFHGGNWSTSVASGISFDFQNAEGNIIKAVDTESTATAFNFANAASVSNNYIWAFLQGNTTDVVFGTASKANYVANLQAGAMTVTDNSAIANWNTVIGPAPGFRFTSAGRLDLNTGTPTAPALSLDGFAGIYNGSGSSLCYTTLSFSEFCFTGAPGLNTRSNGSFGWVASGNPDGAQAGGISSPAAGFITADTSTIGNALGVFASDGNTVALTADWTCGTAGTVASCAAATIIGSGGGVPLTFTLPLVARSWTWECDLIVGQAGAATSNQWNILTATNGATNVTAYYDMYTAAGVKAAGAVTDQASTTTTFQIAPNWTLGGTGTKMPVHIWGRVEGVSVSGTVLSLQLLAPTPADVVTIFRGSSCRIR